MKFVSTGVVIAGASIATIGLVTFVLERRIRVLQRELDTLKRTQTRYLTTNDIMYILQQTSRFIADPTLRTAENIQHEVESGVSSSVPREIRSSAPSPEPLMTPPRTPTLASVRPDPVRAVAPDTAPVVNPSPKPTPKRRARRTKAASTSLDLSSTENENNDEPVAVAPVTEPQLPENSLGDSTVAGPEDGGAE